MATSWWEEYDFCYSISANVNTNPYGLQWAARVTPNPNLDEAIDKIETAYCVSMENGGLMYRRCTHRLAQFICSKSKGIVDLV